MTDSKTPTKTKAELRKERVRKYALNPAGNRSRNAEFIDFDYVDKLGPEERRWLETFSAEFYGTTFDGVTDLHTPEQRKEIYNADNARRRDVFNRRARVGIEELTEEAVRPCPRPAPASREKKP